MMTVIKYSERATALKGKLFVYNYQYRSLNGFDKKLGDLMFSADSNNQLKLILGFPEEMQAVINYQTVNGWWEECEEDVKEYYNNKRQSLELTASTKE